MDLIHNTLFQILFGPDTGLYRVVLDELQIGRSVVVRLNQAVTSDQPRRGRKKLDQTKLPRKKAPSPLVGNLIWMDRNQLQLLVEAKHVSLIQLETESVTLSQPDQTQFNYRREVMKGFLDFENLRESILIHKNLSGLVAEAELRTGSSRPFIYKLFSLLCRFGFYESSLHPRRDRCGARGIPRPCDVGGRKKAGAKTAKQRVARAYGSILAPDQPGMSSEWRNLILAADNQIPTPKPAMPQRCKLILNSVFVKRYRQDGSNLVAVDPSLGEYPNKTQIQRVLKWEIPRLDQLMQKTTKGHFTRNHRGLIARNWKGVAGPGHTWAIDSTIGDIYLRSSINRAWIIGRPVVYIIVDVWSTAIVGFYVCLTGPSWDMAKISLFCSAASPELIGELWGYQPKISLSPSPTMAAILMCDRGEYLSKAASFTGMKLIPSLSYAPPYRPELKGLVEVLHRIEKDRQYLFVPGAIDQRRQEYELRRFNADEAVLTVRDYTLYLYTIFTEYNLTADRNHRVDAHMKGTGVFPSPAGLWRWGHEMGIGVRRHIPLSELVTNLLPVGEGKVTRNGVMFNGRHYRSNFVDEQQWSAHARNFGSWDIPTNHFPGTVSRIWTPNSYAPGLLDLRISDESTASPELTVDEVTDAYVFSKLSKAEIEHMNTLTQLQALRHTTEIIANAKRLTFEALSRHNGLKPTMTQSRQLEASIIQIPSTTSVVPEHNVGSDEASVMHLEMMRSIFAAANAEQLDNE